MATSEPVSATRLGTNKQRAALRSRRFRTKPTGPRKRALGPSLAAAGVQQFAPNPKLDVFDASGQRVGTNLDWQNARNASELTQNYTSLVPANAKEAALLLTLLPGNYTLQGTNEDGADGVILLEAYDVDSTIQ